MRRSPLPSTILLLVLAFAGGAGFAGDGRSEKARSIGGGAGFAGDGRSPQGGALAGADDRARLLSVTAGGDADSAVIAFEGDRPLSFTTLQLQTPPRVVVDFADTSVAGVPAELSVEDGTVRRVATAEVGAGTARVVIELAADAEFDVRAKGNRLEVRVPRIAPFVAQAPAPPARPPEQVAQAQPPPVRPPEEVAQQAPAPAQPPAEQIAQAPAAPPPAQRPPVEAPPSEAEKRASLPTVSLVGSRPSPAPEPKPLSPAEEKKRRAAEKLAAQKRAAAEAAEAKKRAREQRLAVAKAAADRAAEAKRAAGEKRALLAAEKKAAADRAAAEKRAAQEARALAAAEKQKKARELAAAEPPRRPKAAAQQAPVEPRTLTVQEAMALREAAEKGLPTGLGPATDKPAAEKSAPARTEAPPARRTAKAEPPRPARTGSSRIAINSIGFRPVGNGEVIIRSDKPLTYGVGGDEHAVLLHLPGSAIPRPNDRRPLDTHFFDGPVLRVVPIDVPGGVDLRIELRAKAEYALSQQGAVLTIAFAAPR